MTEVCSIRFKSRGKSYFFDPGGNELKQGDSVIVETSNGLELGECYMGNYYVPDERIIPPLRPVLRKATQEDLQAAQRNKKRESEAFAICQQKIADHGLDMKLVDVEYNFEGNKILFFFTSDGRVDFRELVKDLASVFRTRIELRQIGVRDEAKMIGGLGICGRAFCCNQFLDDFQPVSTKMAKTQSMSLNQSKISGSCGRLMCCLRYEQEAYEDLLKSSPKTGTFVETPSGYGNISQVSLLRQRVKVSIDGTGEPVYKVYNISDIAVIPGGRPAPGEPLPSLLDPEVKRAVLRREEEQRAESVSSRWSAPEQERSSAPPVSEQKSEDGQKKRTGRRSGKRGPVKPGDNVRRQTPAAAPRESADKQQIRQSAPKKPPAPRDARPARQVGEQPRRAAAEGEVKAEGKSEKKRSFRPRRPGKNPNAENSAR